MPSMRSEANQEETIEAASASMSDHERADAVLGSKLAGPEGACAGVVCAWRWGPSASGVRAGTEGAWAVS